MIAVKTKKWIWISGGGALLLFYFIFDPVKYGWMPQCFFHKFTGLQCIGCGSQRVIHALLHGDIASAMQANALMVLSLPFLAFLIWLELSRTRHPYLYRRLHSLPMIISVLVVMFVWLIIRNLLQI